MKKLLSLAAITLAALSANAVAVSDNQDIARDQHGQQIYDFRDNCVYTNWVDPMGGCREPLARVVYFDFNKSSLKASERAKLDALIAAVQGADNVESVTLVGHADRIGASDYNVQLSKKRVLAVRNYLASRGVKVRDFKMRAEGENRPVTACDPNMGHRALVACLAEDRRVEIVLNYAM